MKKERRINKKVNNFESSDSPNSLAAKVTLASMFLSRSKWIKLNAPSITNSTKNMGMKETFRPSFLNNQNKGGPVKAETKNAWGGEARMAHSWELIKLYAL